MKIGRGLSPGRHRDKGNAAHIEWLDAWFKTSDNPKWKVKWMIANTGPASRAKWKPATTGNDITFNDAEGNYDRTSRARRPVRGSANQAD